MRGLAQSPRLISLAALVVLCTLAGCDLITGSEDEYGAVVDLYNGSSDPVHMFAPGESFPCCRVNGKATRPKQMTFKPNQRVTIRAGRNGQIIAECSLRAPATKPEFAAFQAEFSDHPVHGPDVHCFSP